MPLVYRVMKQGEDGKPLVGHSATSLGVRVPTDIRPDLARNVGPGTGGMSVSPSLAQLPALLVPTRLRHLVRGAKAWGGKLRIWKMGSGPFVAGPSRQS